jgi:hypothetical protein
VSRSERALGGIQDSVQSTKPSYRASIRLRVLALLGIFGQAIFILVVVLLPFFQPGYSSFDDPISALLIGSYGFVLSGALFAAGVGSVVLGFGIHQATRGARWGLLGSILIMLWGIGFAFAGIVFTDAQGRLTDAARTLHGSAVGLAFLSVVPGILMVSKVFARDARWSSFYPLSMALGFAAAVGLIDFMSLSAGLADLRETVGPIVGSFEGRGFVQRMFVGTVILWMMLVAVRLHWLAKGRRFDAPSD